MTMSTSNDRKRKSRLVRHKRSNPVTESEILIELLRLVLELRWATTDQLQLFTGLHRNTMQYHLRRLYDHHLVERVPALRSQTAMGGSPKLVYRLNAKGKDVLNRHLGMTDFSAVPSGELSPYFAPHIIAINDVRAMLYRGCQLQGWSIHTWIDERTIRADYDTVHVAMPSTKSERTYSLEVPIVPDAHFTIDMGEAGIGYFMLEVDRGSETTKTFQKKVLGYVEYIRNGGFERRYHHGAFRVLTVVDTPTPSRLETLLLTTERVPKIANRFWFCSFQDLKPETIIHQPLWTIAGTRTESALAR